MPVVQTLLDNRYSILHIERTSNFSQVLFALDTYQNPPRSCVIEIYKPITQKPEIERWIAKEFQQEAARLKQLSLTNQYLPEIYTYFSDFKAYYLVRELIKGTTLRQKVQTQGKLSTEIVRKILIKLLSVLDYLHQERVIHQNIKPQNIILRHSDNAPILINFGSIKQIVATLNFYGDKKISFLNDAHGYAPSEQALGKSIPASDLYSLGLTAIYLLTAKNPVELSIELNSGSYQIPPEIKNQAPDLAKIIARAINLDSSERYSSAKEMQKVLLATTKTSLNYNGTIVVANDNRSPKNHLTLSGSIVSQGTKLDANHRSNLVKRNIGGANLQRGKMLPLAPGSLHSAARKRRNSSKWLTKLIFVTGGLYLFSLSVIIWYNWNLSRDNFEPQLPASLPSSPTILSELPETASITKPSMLNSKSENLIEIPIFTTGIQKKQLRKVLGEPNTIQKGYWKNSSAWIYKDLADGSIDLGYLFDLDTDKLRQTEMAIAPSVGLEAIEEILNSLLQGKISEPVTQELEKIYKRQANVYSFKLGNLEGSIERDRNDNIYIGVWEADFHAY